MLRIAVIGSGASALAAIEGALSLDLDIQIDVFDPWNEIPNHRDGWEKNSPTQMAKKSRFGSLAMYEYPSNVIEYEPNLHIPLSGTVGGLTSVWGANSTFPEPDQILVYTKQHTEESIKWVSDYAHITDLGKVSDSGNFFISTRFRNLLFSHKQKGGIEIKPATLSLIEQKCTKIGGCLSGCQENAIFSAEQKIHSLIGKENITLIKALVLKILPIENSRFSLELEGDLNYEILNIEYDKILVTCGAIASCALLQRSELISTRVRLKDTQVFYSAFLMRESRIVSPITFELAQIFIRKSKDIHVSMYEYSSQFVQRAKLIIGPLVTIIPKRFWNHIVAGIGFIDSSESGFLNLDYRNNVTYVTQKPNSISKVVIRQKMALVRKNLKGLRIFHIPFLTQIPNVGASYHVGAANIGGLPVFTPAGKLVDRSQLEIYVLDSAALHELPVGPITTTVMAIAYGRTKLALFNE
jgi:ferredoxin